MNILLDLIKLRDAVSKKPGMIIPDAHYYSSPNSNGLKTIRELATFRFVCRRCEDAPCIAACPAEALEKDDEGLINRNTNLCVSCKSCVVICPFGTMMTDFFRHHRNRDILYDLNDQEDVAMFIKAFPEGIVSYTELEENPAGNIYRLNEKVLIREYLYNDR